MKKPIPMAKKNSLLSVFISFKYAFKGLILMFHGERNFYVHILASVFALTLAFYFPLSPAERAIIVIMIALVLAAEILNSSIERLTDLVQPSFNKKAAEVKDLAAAAVFVLAIASVAVASIIFLPYILLML